MPETLVAPTTATAEDVQLTFDDELATRAAEEPSRTWDELGGDPVLTPSPETPAVEAVAPVAKPEAKPYTPEDWQRVELRAKEFPDFLNSSFEDRGGEIDREGIMAARVGIKKYAEKFKKELTDQLTSLKLSAEDQTAIDEAVKIEKDQAMSEVVDHLSPKVEDAGRKAKKRSERRREDLKRMLTMSDEEFSQLAQDWEHHDANVAQSAANKEDKKYNRKAEHTAATGELAKLDAENGGVLTEVSAMPLDRSKGGATEQVLGGYLTTQAEIGQKDPRMQEVLQKANVDKALGSLQESLKAGYSAEGLSEAQVLLKLTENAPALRKWLEAQDGSTDPLVALEKYGLQRNKETMLAARQQKVRQYLGPTVLKQVFGSVLRGEKAPGLRERINLAAELSRAIDPSGGRRRAGAQALRHTGKVGSLWGRVMTQLETARNLSRNEGVLMKSRLYITAMERGLGDSLVTAYEAIPPEQIEKARKAKMVGMAMLAAYIRRRSSKPPEKP